jgi:hypothetical protein
MPATKNPELFSQKAHPAASNLELITGMMLR